APVTPRAAMPISPAASVLAFSSPRPSWSGPVRRLPLTIATCRVAPGCGSGGHVLPMTAFDEIAARAYLEAMDTVEDLLAADPSLLLVDDDVAFLTRLERAMERRGFEVRTANSVAAGLAAVAEKPPAYAVVDLRLEDGNGLDVVSALHQK